MRSNGFVAGGHECIVALRGCFDVAAQTEYTNHFFKFFVCSRPVRLFDGK
jgi:hypothetical protein